MKVLIIEPKVLIRRFLTDAVNNTQIAEAVHASPNIELALMWLEHNNVNMLVMSAHIFDKVNMDILKCLSVCFSTIILITENLVNYDLNVFQSLGNITKFKLININMSEPDDENKQIISDKLRVIVKSGIKEERTDISKLDSLLKDIKINQKKNEKWTSADIVLIASSTGGPVALEKVFKMFPEDFKKPILVVQHLPHGFTAGLVKTIKKLSGMRIVEGEDGEEVCFGKAIFAPGGYHMVVSKNKHGTKKIELLDADMVNGVKPSADVLFRSISEEYEGKNILVAVLTGMGQDGAEGVKELKNNCNCYCITQKISTCVAFGMPKSVQDLSLSDNEVDIEHMAFEIYKVSHGI